MKRGAAADTALAVILGAVGAIVRRIELNTIFEPSGLAKAWQPATIALLVLSAASIVLFVLRGLRYKGAAVSAPESALFGGSDFALLAIRLLSAAALAAGAVFYYINGSGLPALLVPALGVIAAAASAVFALAVYQGKNSGGLAAASAITVLFLCIWMVFEYRERSADPVLLDYMYDFLAICSAALAFYYSAGFLFERPRPAQALFMSRTAVYFCILCAANPRAFSGQTLFFIFCVLRLIADSFAVQSGLPPSEKAK